MGLSVPVTHLTRYPDKTVKHPQCFVARDETRIDHATPENKIKQTSKHPSPPSKEIQSDTINQHKAMVMITATVFRDHTNELVVDFIYCSATVTAQNDCGTLQRHSRTFRANGLGCCAKPSSLCMTTPSPYVPIRLTTGYGAYSWDFTDNTCYRPDLAPNHFHPFGSLTKQSLQSDLQQMST
jgi:hypothetical protein